MSGIASDMNDDALEADFMAEVERICKADPALTPLSAGIMAGISLNIADDSRTFSRVMGIEHAPVLREVDALVQRGHLTITRRDERTQRSYYTARPLG